MSIIGLDTARHTFWLDERERRDDEGTRLNIVAMDVVNDVA